MKSPRRHARVSALLAALSLLAAGPSSALDGSGMEESDFRAMGEAVPQPFAVADEAAKFVSVPEPGVVVQMVFGVMAMLAIQRGRGRYRF